MRVNYLDFDVKKDLRENPVGEPQYMAAAVIANSIEDS